ncbi:MAG: Crp/Fnr family transcriptional regulator [Leptolyngbya sp. SIO3F4]|nr:Crp/Fnr family transcriptional regulator [Leptolyngbya sp. SIO3F4]
MQPTPCEMTLASYVQQHIDSDFDGDLPFPTREISKAKGEVIIDFGQTAQNIYFLQRGVVIAEVRSKKENRILDFFFASSFFASYSALLLNRHSDVRISAFKDCDLEVVRYAALKEAYQHSLLANKLGRIETEKLYLRKVTREKELLTQTAEQRYASLLSSHPEIIREIPIKDISLYLGIQPESLSRIRKRLIS